MPEDNRIDTSNDFFLGVQGSTYSFMLPPVGMTKAQALRAAAWLVALADPLEDTFPSVLSAVMST